MNALETHVLRLIGENPDSPDVFTDTDAGLALVRTSINDAIAELCMVTGSYRKSIVMPLYENRMFYRLGFERDLFGWVVEAWDPGRRWRLSQTSARRLFDKDVDFLSRTGSPDEYFQVGHDVIGIWRKPSANGTILELNCVMIPKPYTTDRDAVRLRHVYETAAAYLAVSEFYASRGNANRATEYLMRYLETAGLLGMHPMRPEQEPVLGGGAAGSR